MIQAPSDAAARTELALAIDRLASAVLSTRTGPGGNTTSECLAATVHFLNSLTTMIGDPSDESSPQSHGSSPPTSPAKYTGQESTATCNFTRSVRPPTPDNPSNEWYVVTVGKVPGIYTNRALAHDQIHGDGKGVLKKAGSYAEAWQMFLEAQEF